MVSHRPLTSRVERSVAKTRRLMILFTLLLCGCSSVSRSASPTPAPVAEATLTPTPSPTQPPTTAPDFVARIRNAEYQLGLTDALRVVQLTDGKFEQGAAGDDHYASIFMTDFVARGDLNGDGANEVAALVAENYGGTGVFVFLAVYSDIAGAPVFQTSLMVDDRPQLNVLSIEGSEIFLDATTHGFEDPLCCPTLKTTRHYRLADGQLDMTDYTTFTPDDRPRTIIISSPASGTEVYRFILIKGSVAIAPFENNLVYRIYDLGGVELAAGAISVSAANPGAPGTFDATIPLGNILSRAVIRLEVQDLNAADGSLFAMNSVELVVK